MLIRQRFQKHVLHFQSHFDFRPFQWSYVSYPCVRTKLVAGGKAFLLHTYCAGLRWYFSHDLLQVLQLSAMLCLGQFRRSGAGGCRNVCRIQFGSSLKVLFNQAQAVGKLSETCARFGSVSFTFCLNSAGDSGFAVKFEWECPLLAPIHTPVTIKVARCHRTIKEYLWVFILLLHCCASFPLPPDVRICINPSFFGTAFASAVILHFFLAPSYLPLFPTASFCSLSLTAATPSAGHIIYVTSESFFHMEELPFYLFSKA